MSHGSRASARLGLLAAFVAAIAVLTLGSYVRPAYAAAGTFKFDASSYTVTEGNSVTITVKRTGSGLTSATISVDIAMTTAEAADYSVSGGSGASDTSSGDLVFSGTTTTKTFTINTAEDADTDNETLDLDINLESSGGALGSPNSITVTIFDDDGPGQLEFTSATYSVTEGNVTANISVRRINGSAGAVTVKCETDDSAVETDATVGDDYDSTSDTLSWSDGASGSKTCTVPINEDSDLEGAEDIKLILTTFTGGATAGPQDTAILTINDDDGTGTIAFSAATYSVNEGSGSVTITVKRTGGTTGTLTVDYDTSDGTAGSADYTTASGTLTFSGSSTSKTFTVPITDDSISEGSETVFLELSNLTGGGVLGTNDTATLTISDNDVDEPVITNLSPASGSTAGNTYVVVTGANFIGTTGITFGGAAVTSFAVVSSTTITLYTPAHSAGTVEVRITNGAGTSTDAGTADNFAYVGTGPVVTGVSPTSGTTAGGTSVAISGSGFSGATSVTFGGTAATFTVNSDTSITATAPAHSAGTVDVIVTTAAGSSTNTSSDNYTYTGAAAPLPGHYTYVLSLKWNLLVWFGGDGVSIETVLKGWEPTDDPSTNSVWTTVTAIYRWAASTQSWLAFFPAGVGIPGANDFTAFDRYVAYWVAVTSGANWTIGTP